MMSTSWNDSTVLAFTSLFLEGFLSFFGNNPLRSASISSFGAYGVWYWVDNARLIGLNFVDVDDGLCSPLEGDPLFWLTSEELFFEPSDLEDSGRLIEDTLGDGVFKTFFLK